MDAVAPLPLRRDCAMYPWTFKENLGRMWHMKVHRNRRTHSASWGLLTGGVLFYIFLRQHDCSSASASFPKKVTQACLPCFHIRGYMSCSSPIFFSSAFTVQIAVFLLSAKVCFKQNAWILPNVLDINTQLPVSVFITICLQELCDVPSQQVNEDRTTCQQPLWSYAILAAGARGNMGKVVLWLRNFH